VGVYIAYTCSLVSFIKQKLRRYNFEKLLNIIKCNFLSQYRDYFFRDFLLHIERIYNLTILNNTGLQNFMFGWLQKTE